MVFLKPGMDRGEEEKVLGGLAVKPGSVNGGVWMFTEKHRIDERHSLYLHYVSMRLKSAQLRNGELVVARVPAAEMAPGELSRGEP
jgi:hypothetical protein